MREHGLGPFGRADLHPRRNPLDRQGRFAPQPGGNNPTKMPLGQSRRANTLGMAKYRSTLSIGAGRIRRTPGIVVSKAFWAFPASACNGWARLWGLAQGREWRRRKTCEPSA